MQDAKRQYEILKAHHLPCIVMEPVRGGTLASPCEKSNQIFKAAEPNRSVASWALRYAASLPNVMTVLSGMSNMEQLKDNLSTMNPFVPLEQAEYQVIEQAVAAYKDFYTIPCTGCRYCMECPAGVEIPKMFALYNQYAPQHDTDGYKKAYLQTPESERVNHCPLHWLPVLHGVSCRGRDPKNVCALQPVRPAARHRRVQKSVLTDPRK